MTALAIFFCFAIAQADDELVTRLASDDAASASAAYDSLAERGVDAFPALAARLDDETEANYEVFRNPTVMTKTRRGWAIYKPNVGDVAFLLIQRQIEGTWPGAFKDHHAITQSNAKDWITKHKGLTLKQLRILAVTESLSSVARELAKDSSSDLNTKCLAYLTERLTKLQEAKDKR
ncbi:hypothetical protein Enr13x_60030 [Stieleria neptunia]|uniref:Uncharacterized protein n=1 Tax=Stieleria neptunia TaxID=2527979 RepID=A0A518HZ30_9BACT|nr:hypothetical protein [Stieleria neptunia]QDV46099.1 hypothetical protein Enr13x_60030 [Stieleria neptunia]